MDMRKRLMATVAAAALAAGGWTVGSPVLAQSANHSHATAIAEPLDIVRLPTDLPPPIGKRGPQTVRVSLDTVEVTGKLADGASYRYWTFNKKVPGPFFRVRVGDTVHVALEESRRQRDDAQCRLSCRHRSARRRPCDHGRPRREEGLQLQGL